MLKRRVAHLRASDEKLELLEQNRILVLDGEIHEHSCYAFCIDSLHRVLAGTSQKGPLLVILNSPGGNVEHGLAIYDCIKAITESGTEVDILGLGLVASMGTVIMQAGTRRFSASSTQFLVHQISQTIEYFKSEEVTQLRERSIEMERINNIVIGIIADRSGIDRDELKNLCSKTDYWLDPSQARQLGTKGLIDEITTEPLSTILRRHP